MKKLLVLRLVTDIDLIILTLMLTYIELAGKTGSFQMVLELMELMVLQTTTELNKSTLELNLMEF